MYIAKLGINALIREAIASHGEQELSHFCYRSSLPPASSLSQSPTHSVSFSYQLRYRRFGGPPVGSITHYYHPSYYVEDHVDEPSYTRYPYALLFPILLNSMPSSFNLLLCCACFLLFVCGVGPTRDWHLASLRQCFMTALTTMRSRRRDITLKTRTLHLPLIFMLSLLLFSFPFASSSVSSLSGFRVRRWFT